MKKVLKVGKCPKCEEISPIRELLSEIKFNDGKTYHESRVLYYCGNCYLSLTLYQVKQVS